MTKLNYIAEIVHKEPLEKIAVECTLLDVYPFEGDDLYRLHCDDGIVDEVLYLHKQAIKLEKLVKLKGKRVKLEGFISCVNRERQKSIFCYHIKSVK